MSIEYVSTKCCNIKSKVPYLKENMYQKKIIITVTKLKFLIDIYFFIICKLNKGCQKTI